MRKYSPLLTLVAALALLASCASTVTPPHCPEDAPKKRVNAPSPGDTGPGARNLLPRTSLTPGRSLWSPCETA